PPTSRATAPTRWPASPWAAAAGSAARRSSAKRGFLGPRRGGCQRHDEARTLIGFIQQDEAPHVGYLATALAELRCRRLGGEGGEPLPGRDLIDRARDTIVGFQAGPRQRANVAFRTQVIERCVADHPRREALLGELRAVG